MIPTPDLSHLSKEDYEHVYEPAEDTFILLDALEEDADFLRALNPRICLEIGSGSGCASTFLAKILGPTQALYLCTDINPRCTTATSRTGANNKVPLDPILASLFPPLRRSTSHPSTLLYDIIVFNPPYVPTDSHESTLAQGSRDLAGSWAGGVDGMELTEKVLDSLQDHLGQRGAFYLVTVARNKPDEIGKRMMLKYGFSCKVVLKRRAGREGLSVLRFTRPST